MSRQLVRTLRLLTHSGGFSCCTTMGLELGMHAEVSASVTLPADIPAAYRSILEQRAGVLHQTQCMRGQPASPCQCLLRLVAPFSSDQSSSGVNGGADVIPKPVAVRQACVASDIYVPSTQDAGHIQMPA